MIADYALILESLRELETKIDNLNLISNSAGIEKKCDSFGRITIPKNVRQQLDIDEETNLKIFVVGNRIVIEKL